MSDASSWRLARAVADGAAVDWDEAVATSDRGTAVTVKQLKILAALSRFTIGRHEAEPIQKIERVEYLLRPVLWLAVAKCGLALIGYAVAADTTGDDTIPAEASLLNLSVFALSAMALLYSGQRDRRALSLGAFFLLIASTFSDRLLRGLPSQDLVRLLRAAPVDAFLGAYLWLFVWRFPTLAPFSRGQRLARLMSLLAVSMGLLLFGSNLILARQGLGAGAVPLAFLDRRANSIGGYWLVLLGVSIPALPFAVWKARTANPQERHRVELFVAGIVIGVAPIATVSILGLPFSPLAGALYRHRWPVGLAVYAFLLSVPITTASSVLTRRVLDLRLLARPLLRYLLARQVMFAASLLPIALLVRHVYVHRYETVDVTLLATRPLLLGSLGLGLVFVARERGPLVRAIDSAFARSRLDARLELARLSEALRGARGLREICAAVADVTTSSFHPSSLQVLLRRGPSLEPRVVAGRAIPTDSALFALLSQVDGALAIDLEDRRNVATLLPELERQWLADSSIQLLVPIKDADGLLLGVVALGERLSGLPYSSDDRLLLRAIAATAAMALEQRLHTAEGQTPGIVGGDEPADECKECLAVMPAGTSECGQCGGALRGASLPTVVACKFEVERRIGEGGAGVVYRARDMTLGRGVALKTLPRLSTSDSVRLRREARAMASVAHENLALIHGAETWRGTPVLVVELLENGTLAQRLQGGALEPPEVASLGIGIAAALECLHASGIVHRDVKPSNIGFQGGVVKLMDFGLAWLADEVGEAAAWNLVGTPVYLSPEAVLGSSPEPSFDLWALAITLFEAVTGVQPMKGQDLESTLDRIARQPIPDAREYRPDCPSALAEFLVRALARNPRDRPATAATFRVQLLSIN